MSQQQGQSRMISHAKIPTEHPLAFVAMATVISVNRENVSLLLFHQPQQTKSFSLEPKYEVIQLSSGRVTWRCPFLNITLIRRIPSYLFVCCASCKNVVLFYYELRIWLAYDVVGLRSLHGPFQ